MSERPLEGKVALITGAGSAIGLGHAMSLAFVSAGARVAMLDIDGGGLEHAARDIRELGGDDAVELIAADVTKPGDALAAVERTRARFDGIDILVNNAAINPHLGLFDLSIETWVRTVNTNLNGPFFMLKAVTPVFQEQGFGRIIGITTSLDTMLVSPAYGPPKAGHEALMAITSAALEGSGITANVLVPGFAVKTNMANHLGLDSLLEPSVMQAPAVWLASGESSGCNGRRIIAQLWDEDLPITERLERASAPVAWPQLGRTDVLRQPSR